MSSIFNSRALNTADASSFLANIATNSSTLNTSRPKRRVNDGGPEVEVPSWKSSKSINRVTPNLSEQTSGTQSAEDDDNFAFGNDETDPVEALTTALETVSLNNQLTSREFMSHFKPVQRVLVSLDMPVSAGRPNQEQINQAYIQLFNLVSQLSPQFPFYNSAVKSLLCSKMYGRLSDLDPAQFAPELLRLSLENIEWPEAKFQIGRLFCLGLIREEGDTLVCQERRTPNFEASKRYLEKAAFEGNLIKAYYFLGQLIEQGLVERSINNKINYRAAAQMYLVAAHKNDPEACKAIGSLILNDHYRIPIARNTASQRTYPDYQNAGNYLEKAAKQGNVGAMVLLAQLIHRGVYGTLNSGLPNLLQAATWAEMAVEYGAIPDDTNRLSMIRAHLSPKTDDDESL